MIDTFELVNDLKLKVAIGERRPGDVEQIYASGLKAKELLKWTPELSLADALIDAWRWQQNLSVEA